MKDGELHITCDCHAHELHFERDSEDIKPWWYISFWIQGYRTTSTWKWRLKYVWHILRTGRPYGDEVILSEPQMKELLVYIQQELSNIKKKL